MMKTVLIFNEFEQKLKFIVLNGAYRHLDGVYINDHLDDRYNTDALQKNQKKKEQELSMLLFDEKGRLCVPYTHDFPMNAVSREHSPVIVCGIIPVSLSC